VTVIGTCGWHGPSPVGVSTHGHNDERQLMIEKEFAKLTTFSARISFNTLIFKVARCSARLARYTMRPCQHSSETTCSPSSNITHTGLLEKTLLRFMIGAVISFQAIPYGFDSSNHSSDHRSVCSIKLPSTWTHLVLSIVLLTGTVPPNYPSTRGIYRDSSAVELPLEC
jgi:hypothetical protein